MALLTIRCAGTQVIHGWFGAVTMLKKQGLATLGAVSSWWGEVCYFGLALGAGQTKFLISAPPLEDYLAFRTGGVLNLA